MTNGTDRVDARPSFLSRATWVPLGVVTVAILSVSGGAVWLNKELSDLNHKVDNVIKSVDALTVEVGDAGKGKVSIEALRWWARLIQAENPTLKIPMPEKEQ